MIEAAIPDNEQYRLRKLYETGILDTFEEEAYDDLTRIAAELCGTPIALVSLIDKDRQWFKSHHGLRVRETPRKVAFCSHAILNNDVFVVEDSSKDERFHDNPLYTGEPHVAFYAGAPLIMGDNIRLGTLCVIGNTARTISESQKQSLKALARQVVSQLELRIKLKDLETLDIAKDEFISTVSHELRTPLTAIFGSLSLLLSKKSKSSESNRQQLIEMSFRNTKSLLNIVNDILDVAAIESGKFKLRKVKLDLKALINNSLGMNDQYFKLCNTNILFQPPGDNTPVSIFGDEQRLLQVMGNLISNAAKFTYENDTIEITLTVDGKNAQVQVIDHGPGIPDEQIGLLFKKFKQINAHINQKLPGTGLGLNISKNIIELHGGTIGVDSVPKVRTTFYFSLPLDA